MSKKKSRERARLRQAVAPKSNGRCWYCGAAGPVHIDHQLPVARGGRDRIDNLVLCCPSCNSRKGKSMLEEFRRRARFLEMAAPYFGEAQEAWLARKGFHLDDILPPHVFYGEIVAGERAKEDGGGA